MDLKSILEASSVNLWFSSLIVISLFSLEPISEIVTQNFEDCSFVTIKIEIFKNFE